MNNHNEPAPNAHDGTIGLLNAVVRKIPAKALAGIVVALTAVLMLVVISAICFYRQDPRALTCFVMSFRGGADANASCLTDLSLSDPNFAAKLLSDQARVVANSPDKLGAISPSQTNYGAWLWTVLQRYQLRQRVRTLIQSRYPSRVPPASSTSLDTMIDSMYLPDGRGVIGDDFHCALRVAAFVTYIAEWGGGIPPTDLQAQFFTNNVAEIQTHLKDLQGPRATDSYANKEACDYYEQVRAILARDETQGDHLKSGL